MRSFLVCMIVSACGVGERQPATATSSASQTVQLSSVASESVQSIRAQSSTLAPGSRTKTAGDLSLLGLMPLSDSIKHVGSGMIDDTYGAFDYITNGIEYLAIVRDIGTKPNGQPLMGIVTTVTLPPMDTAEHLMFSGLCGTNNKSDPYVLAVVGIGGDSVYRNIKKAWRFDRDVKALREIPTKNVVCFDPMGGEP